MPFQETPVFYRLVWWFIDPEYSIHSKEITKYRKEIYTNYLAYSIFRDNPTEAEYSSFYTCGVLRPLEEEYQLKPFPYPAYKGSYRFRSDTQRFTFDYMHKTGLSLKSRHKLFNPIRIHNDMADSTTQGKPINAEVIISIKGFV